MLTTAVVRRSVRAGERRLVRLVVILVVILAAGRRDFLPDARECSHTARLFPAVRSSSNVAFPGWRSIGVRSVVRPIKGTAASVVSATRSPQQNQISTAEVKACLSLRCPSAVLD